MIVWTNEMLTTLRDFYVTHGAAYVLALHPALTARQVYSKATEMGLIRRPRKTKNNEPVFGLTPGELAVLRVIAEGLGTKHVARVLRTSLSSVTGRLDRVFVKLSVRGQVGAVLKAERAGLLAGVEPFTKVES